MKAIFVITKYLALSQFLSITEQKFCKTYWVQYQTTTEYFKVYTQSC